ncbi:MAG: hypothetical protein WBB29_09445 [Geitlerinemataceae cyanobacterium]
MNYDVIALACEQLTYREKLRLAQMLIQMATKEEEELHPQNRSIAENFTKSQSKKENRKESTKRTDINIQYIQERVLKLKPSTQKALVNSIKAMFQFQGDIAEKEIDKIINELQKNNIIKFKDKKITY